jgi:membrane-bound lytic murein transglycosylase A
VLTTLFLAAALVASPVKARALEPLASPSFPSFQDDLPAASLEDAIAKSLAYFESEGSSRTFAVGGRTLTAAQMAGSLKLFLSDYQNAAGPSDLARRIAEHFDVLSSTDAGGKVLFTGYYLPVLDASLEKKDEYRYPLYARPPDLVEVDAEMLQPARRGERLWGRVAAGKLEPYLSRDEIDFGGALDGKGLELAWLKSRWDVLDAQIQGSAVLRLPDGSERRALFDGTNGLSFKSPARSLVELGLLPKDHWSSQSARAYLKSHPEDERRVFAADARYAFFKLEPAKPGEGPLGTIKQPLVDERSIAVDSTLFPLGGLAYYVVDLPKPGGGTRKAARFALMQDTGGAISGPRRVDVYIGRGDKAFAVAGRLKADGELYILIRKGP